MGRLKMIENRDRKFRYGYSKNGMRANNWLVYEFEVRSSNFQTAGKNCLVCSTRSDAISVLLAVEQRTTLFLKVAP